MHGAVQVDEEATTPICERQQKQETNLSIRGNETN